jgi:hypothetical protein
MIDIGVSFKTKIQQFVAREFPADFYQVPNKGRKTDAL